MTLNQARHRLANKATHRNWARVQRIARELRCAEFISADEHGRITRWADDEYARNRNLAEQARHPW